MKTDIVIEVIPASGKRTEKTVRIDPTGVSLAEALENAGIALDKNMQVTVNGKPVTDTDMHVENGAKVLIEKRRRGFFKREDSRPRVQVAERASGS